MKFLSDPLIDIAFERLTYNSEGKTPMERTSALMYFLAFDSVVRSSGPSPLDLNHASASGKRNRDLMGIEFVQLVQLKKGSDKRPRQISALGQISNDGKAPEKRISSNFFTVPLKKASEMLAPYYYPQRPAPVFKMGKSATGIKWGLDYHESWQENLPKLLRDVKSSTPFTDLAVIVLRNRQISKNPNDLQQALIEGLEEKYTDQLRTFWIKRVNSELIFCKHGNDPFQTSPGNPLAMEALSRKTSASRSGEIPRMTTSELEDRIRYLEKLLDLNNILY